MAISKEDWNRTAWHAAAAAHGEKHAKLYSFRRYGAKPTGVLLLVVGVGFGAYWVWNAVGDLLSGGVDLSVPAPMWSIFLVLVVASAVLLRPRRMPSSPVSLIVRAGIVLLAWLAYLAFLIGTLI